MLRYFLVATFWLENPRGRDNFGKCKCRLEDSIKLDLSKVGCKGIDWTELAQDRVQWQEFLSAIFIKKIGSGMHRVSQNLVGEWG
jgi:hypothetical protein